MKDYYSSLHKFLSSHFPAQIHKLEAIEGNDVEVIKMYNMYKQLAKDKLQERQESADGNKSQDVAKGIHTAINNVDESLHYRDFAKAVAITLKENYGTHNIAPFMEVLHAELGINEVKVESLEEELKKGDKIKFKDGSIIYILGPKGDGYDYRGNGREKGHHPKGWFDMMFKSGKATIGENQSYASSFGTSSKKIDKEEVEVALNKRGYDTPRTGIWNKILVKKDGERIGMIDTEESTYTRDGKKYEWEGISDFIDHTKPLKEDVSKHTVKHSKSNNTYQVWLGDEIVTDFATKERADAEAKRLNALQDAKRLDKGNESVGSMKRLRGWDLSEAKATCCHRCGRVHVKGTPCKKPYLKGKDSCAINEIKTLKEFYNK